MGRNVITLRTERVLEVIDQGVPFNEEFHPGFLQSDCLWHCGSLATLILATITRLGSQPFLPFNEH